jgi:hypothetical protein
MAVISFESFTFLGKDRIADFAVKAMEFTVSTGDYASIASGNRGNYNIVKNTTTPVSEGMAVLQTGSETQKLFHSIVATYTSSVDPTTYRVFIKASGREYTVDLLIKGYAKLNMNVNNVENQDGSATEYNVQAVIISDFPSN